MCAWVYFIVTLLPVIGLIQVGIQSAADRYMYLPSLSLFMLCGLGVSYFWSQTASGRFGKKMRPLLLLSLGFLFLSLSAITVQQISVWKSGFALWSYVIRVFPDTAFFAYDNLGSFFEHEGKLDQAIPYYKKALSINPYYRQARNNLGKAYAQMNLYDQAIFEFKEAIRMSPSFEIAYINLGHLYLQRGELDEAIGQFQKALEIKPDYAEAYFQLGSAYSQKGKLDQGISAFQNAILYNKDYADVYFNMGVVYTYQKKMDLAIASLKRPSLLIHPMAPQCIISANLTIPVTTSKQRFISWRRRGRLVIRYPKTTGPLSSPQRSHDQQNKPWALSCPS